MRSTSLKLVLVAALFAGCSTKQCGVDEKIFKTFSPQKQEEICKLYVQGEAQREKLYEKRRLIEEQNRKLELQNENLKLKILYKKYDRFGDASDIIDVSLRGSVGSHSKRYAAYPVEFSIARGEARKVCLAYRHGTRCFWIAYEGDSLLFNIDPDSSKRWMRRYVIEGDVQTSRHTVVIPVDTVRATTIEFERYGTLYHLTLRIHRGCRY